MQNPPPVQSDKSSTGLDVNIASLLAYVFGWVSGLIFFLMEKSSQLVRFHAMQSILLNVVVGVIAVVLTIVLSVLALILGQISGALASIATLLWFLFWMVFSVAILIVWVMCLLKAYQGQKWKIPFIGDYAEKFSAPK